MGPLAADKKWIFLVVFIVLLFAAFIAGNKYWFYPEYTTRITPPPSYSPPVDSPNSVIIKPYEGTLRKILEQSEVSGDTGKVMNGDTRNPFLKPGELDPPPPKPPGKVIMSVEIPNLGMIITGGERKSVMLDGNLVREADHYGSHVVKRIESKSVILSGEYGELRIRMPSSSFGDPEVDILEKHSANLIIKPIFKEKKKGRRDR